MYARAFAPVRLVALLLALSLLVLPGCACSTDTSGSAAEPPATEPSSQESATPNTSSDDDGADGESPEAEEEMPPLANEALYLALLEIGLERSGLTIADGDVTVTNSMEGYGSIRWESASGDRAISITLRDVSDEWRWDYQDESVDISDATPDAFSPQDHEQYLVLAKRIIAAVGKDGSDVAELYTWKNAASGVMQGDYSFGGADEDLRLHIASDAEGRLGYTYLTRNQ